MTGTAAGPHSSPALPAVVLLQAIPAAGAIIFLLSQSQNAVALAVLCLSSLLCAACYVVGRDGIVSFAALFVGCYAALYLIYPMSALALGLQLPRDERVSEYAFMTVLGLSLFLVAHALTSRKSLRLSIPSLQPAHVARAFWIFIVPLVGALILVAHSWRSAASLIAATRLLIKDESSGLTLMAHYMWVAGCVGLVLGPLYLRKRPLGWIPFLGLVAVAAVTGFLAFRTRSVLVLPLGSVVLGMWLRRQVAWQSDLQPAEPQGMRLSSPAFWKLALVAVVAVVAVSYVRIARGLFEERGVAGLTEVNVGEALLHNLRAGDLGFAPIVFDAMGYVPERADYLRGQSYYRLLFTPIPRSVWPDKPPNTQRIVASWLHPDRPQQTTPPGIQGDLFINFGLAGVIGFVVYGCLFGLLDRWSGLGRAIAVGAGLVPVFHLVRGGFTNPILQLSTMIAAAMMAAAIAEGRVRLVLRRISP